MDKKAASNHDALSVGHLLMMEQVTVQLKQAMNHLYMMFFPLRVGEQDKYIFNIKYLGKVTFGL